MQVTLVQHDPNAADLLIFTKNTRLNLSPGLFEDIKGWSVDKKLVELEYISKTIPSSWEFVHYTFLITGVSRAFTHQFVRNRHGSYAQQSMRVTNMEEFQYVTGPSLHGGAEADYHAGMALIEQYYHAVINQGAFVEDARGLLPTNICTNIIAKFNLRTLSELTRSRTGGRTQQEYRRVINEMADEVLKVQSWAGMFLFPKSRGYFEEIEEFIALVPDKELAQNMLKAVDKMRKDA